MSSNDQSHMKQDCESQRECMQMLQLIVDGEATPEQKENFMANHLENCMPCFKNYHLEMSIRELLRLKCINLAPQELVDTIRAQVIQNLAD